MSCIVSNSPAVRLLMATEPLRGFRSTFDRDDVGGVLEPFLEVFLLGLRLPILTAFFLAWLLLGFLLELCADISCDADYKVL